jgi:hypothetical protein
MSRPTTAPSRRIALGLAGVLGGAALAAITAAGPAQAAVAGSAQAADRPARCTISALPVPAGTTRSGVNTSDPTGRYLLGDAAVVENGYSTLVNLLWTDGRLTDFATPWADTVIDGINANKELVGTRPSADGTVQLPWRYGHGKFTDLPLLTPGDAAQMTGINARGDAVGDEYNMQGGNRVVVWPADRPGTVRELALPAGVQTASPVGIDDDGTVVGTGSTGSTGDTAQVSVVWPAHGTPQVLRTPDGGTLSGAVGIRNGWVGGWAGTSTGSVPVRWNLRTGTVEAVNGQPYAIVYSINRHGTLTAQLGQQGTLDHRGRVVQLPGFTTDDWRAAKTITDTGIAAGFDNTNGSVQAVVWRRC